MKKKKKREKRVHSTEYYYFETIDFSSFLLKIFFQTTNSPTRYNYNNFLSRKNFTFYNRFHRDLSFLEHTLVHITRQLAKLIGRIVASFCY